VVVAPASTIDATNATALAVVGSRLDWIATIGVLGVGPAMMSRFVPRLPTWIRAFGHVALLAGAVTLVSLFTGTASTVGVLIIPVGMIWHLAAMIALSR
jgi:hypothetical protein